MQVTILTVTGKQPSWLLEGVEEFTRRLKARVRIEIIDLKAESRAGQRPVDTLRRLEADRVLARLPKPSRCIVLDERGNARTTRQLADEMSDWKRTGEHIVFVIGGPDGHDEQVRVRADQLWSLSKLTLPHGLAKLVLVEQLYRALSVLEGHPYHRE